MELRPAATLCDHRYELDRLLGSGGMATVWLARDRQLERSVAVKVISDALASDPRYVGRLPPGGAHRRPPSPRQPGPDL